MNMKINNWGFTLIEIITVLIIVGILAAVAGQGIVSATRGFLMAKNNAETAGKSQMAISRIVREFTEIVDVTAASSTGIAYTRLDGAHSLALVGNNIRMADTATLPTAGSGNVLIDQVSGLNLQYFKGDSPWVLGTDDIDLLSAISVDLSLDQPDGTTQTFSTTITPRNNGNVGGGPPPSSSNVPPVYDNGCFIGTATGSARTWPVWMALLLLGLLISAAAARQAPKPAPDHGRIMTLKTDRHGAILVGIIITIVIMAVLGAAMFSMTTTSTIREVSSNLASQAYYLAESGYRYAATEYQDAPDADGDGIAYNPDDKNAVQKAINDHGPYSVGAAQQFDLTIEPFYFVTGSGHATGDTVIRTSRPGQAPADQLIPNTGTIQIQFSESKKDYNYTAYSNGNFTLATGLTSTDPLVQANTDHLNVLLVNHPAAAATLSEGGNLTLANAGFFPDRNGTFTIEGSLGSYAYETRSGNILQNITVVENPTAQTLPLSLTTANQVVLDPFVRLTSVGTAGTGAYQVSRQIMYRVPIGAVITGTSAGQKQTYADKMDDLNHWHQPSVFGSHEITTVDGNSAMHVTGTDTYTDWLSGTINVSLIALNWGPSWVDFNTAWYNSGKFLSYDVQTKIKSVTSDNYYMAGINIRMDLPTNPQSIDDLSGLGISLMRESDSGLIRYFDGIPDDVTPPIYNTPLIVLWQKTNAGLVWLAYRALTQTDFDITPVIFSDNMEHGINGWNATSPWALVSNQYHTASHSWHDSPSGDYGNNLNIPLRSMAIDTTGVSAASLVFWHKYDINWLGDVGYVEVSNNNSTWTNVYSVYGTRSWDDVRINIPAEALSTGTLYVRFRLVTDGVDSWLRPNGDGWYIDDVAVEKIYAPNFDTMLVRVQEKTADANPFSGQRVNDLRIYLGDTIEHPTPDGNLTDAQRHANPRWTGSNPVADGQVVWPPDDPADWDTAHDHFTLVRNWVINSTYVGNIKPGLTDVNDPEYGGVLRLNIHTTNPNASVFSQQEIGLHTFGATSTSVYFDDFAVQLAGATSSNNRGYRSPIQE